MPQFIPFRRLSLAHFFYFSLSVAPEINNSSISHTVNEGERVTLSCKASGCPAPTITWKKTGNDTFSHVGETYTFSYPVPEDDGEYICNATAQGQSRSEKGTLIVLCKYASYLICSYFNVHRKVLLCRCSVI